MIVCILWASIDSRILNNHHPPPPPNFPLKRFQCYNLSILTQKYKWKEKCLSFSLPFFSLKENHKAILLGVGMLEKVGGRLILKYERI